VKASACTYSYIRAKICTRERPELYSCRTESERPNSSEYRPLFSQFINQIKKNRVALITSVFDLFCALGFPVTCLASLTQRQRLSSLKCRTWWMRSCETPFVEKISSKVVYLRKRANVFRVYLWPPCMRNICLAFKPRTPSILKPFSTSLSLFVSLSLPLSLSLYVRRYLETV